MIVRCGTMVGGWEREEAGSGYNFELRSKKKLRSATLGGFGLG